MEILLGSSQPLKHHGDAHDHIAEHHNRTVEVFAVLQGSEHTRQADRENQHTDHLDHRNEPKDPVVSIVSRREP